MRLIAIETSCDETAVAIIERRGARTFRVLANVVSSQIKIHEKFGGVVPNLARREHEKNLPAILFRALRTGGFSISPPARPAKGEAPPVGGPREADQPRTDNSKLLRRRRIDLEPIISKKERLDIEKILEREPELLRRFKKIILPLKKPAIDAIAVTNGPGLAPALWAGVNLARALATLWHVPLIPVNHMEGHIFSALRTKQKRISNSKLLISKKDSPTNRPVKLRHGAGYSLTTIHYPAVALLVSGGHTELHLIKKIGGYKRLGETLDDAAGEAFDKVAKMLGLPYPGGPAISKLAEKGDPYSISFPRPMINSKNYDFSFSGLKTSVLYYLRDHPLKPNARNLTPDIAASFEQAAVDVLISKTIRAAKEFGAKTVLIGGGVAANKKLRRELGKKIAGELPGTLYLTPDPKDTSDNALMIALAALYGRQAKLLDKKMAPSVVRQIGADANTRLC